ncbi:MAG TPA: peptidylprolyl isomerase, partial [Dehalococcoidia bacterium]|nr:peptidylprolyl isomerase [Dehalococcoidia bacterium]
ATVFKVADRDFSYSFFERRAISDETQGYFDPQNVQNSVLAVAGRIEREEIIRKMARDQGLTITDDELNQAIAQDLNAPPNASRADVATLLHADLLRIKLPLADYEDIIRARVAQQKIMDKLEAPMPAEADQVDVFLIETATQADAIQAKQRIDNGEKFEDVAKAVSTDDSKDNGGDKGWTPKGILPKEVEDAAFSKTGLSDVIESGSGFYLIDVRGHENRALSDTQKAQLAQQQFDDMLVKTATDAPVVNLITNGQLQSIGDKLNALAAATARG